MRRRVAAACVVILAGLAGLLQYTLQQMAIVSGHFLKNIYVFVRFSINTFPCYYYM